MLKLLLPAAAVCSTLALAGCGGSHHASPSTAASTSAFTDKQGFETYIAQYFVSDRKARTGADDTVSNLDCVKSSATSARCTLDAKDAKTGATTRFTVVVKCQSASAGTGRNCTIVSTPAG